MDDAISPARGLCDAHYDVQDEQHHLFSSAHPSSAPRLRDFVSQADVLRLDKHVLLQLSCPCRQRKGQLPLPEQLDLHSSYSFCWLGPDKHDTLPHSGLPQVQALSPLLEGRIL
eukprot:1155687-Pelagomonas_calceolata.AAC.6